MDAARGRAVRAGRRCRATSTPRTCSRRRCARTSPSSRARRRSWTGRGAQLDAAQLLGLHGGRDPRGHPPDRQGRRRAGRPVRDDHRRASAAGRPPARAAADADSSRRRAARATSCCRCAGEQRADVKVAVLKGGRSLERQVSLRSAARVEDALGSLGHEVVSLDVGADLVARPEGRAARRRASSPCTARAARTGPRRSCSRSSASPTPAPGVAACIASHGQGRSPSTCCGQRGPDARLGRRSTRPRSASWAPPTRSRRSRQRSASRSSSSRPPRARRSGFASRPRAPTSRRHWSRPSATTTGSCSSATSRGASSRCRCSTPSRCRSSRCCPREEDLFNYEARYEIGRTEYVVPRRADG